MSLMDTAHGLHVIIAVKQCQSCIQVSGKEDIFTVIVSGSIKLISNLVLGKEELPWQESEGEMKNGARNGKVTVYKDDDSIHNEVWNNNRFVSRD